MENKDQVEHSVGKRTKDQRAQYTTETLHSSSYLFYRRNKILGNVHTDSCIDKFKLGEGFFWHRLQTNKQKNK